LLYKFTEKQKKSAIQRGNQNPYIEEEQKTQWPKEKGQKDKQRNTKHTYKVKDRVTRTPLKTGRVIYTILKFKLIIDKYIVVNTSRSFPHS
jgi:hypothetical protein